MGKKIRFAHLLQVCLCLACLSCTVHQVKENPDPPIKLPPQFSSSGKNTSQQKRWWKSFNDQELNGLVKTVLEKNLDIAQAWDRLAQAEALARIAGANLSPQVNLQANASRAKTVAIKTSTNNSFFFNPSVSYEIDLWGRIRSSRNASIMDLNASRKDLESTAITITALLVKTWYSITEQETKLKLLKKQLETNRKLLDLVKLRFSQGKTTAVAVYQQQQQLALTRTRIPPVKSRLEIFQHQLAVLLGKPPREKLPEPGAGLPELPPLPATGFPADLLWQRPDVRALQDRVTASDYRLASAIADMFPRLSFGAGIVNQSDKISNLFDNWAWNIAGNLVQPLIDGGRRQAEIDRNRAELRGKLHAYTKSILTAIKEVEDALTQERRQREFLDELEDQIQILGKNLEAATNRFLNGQSDYLPVLSALNILQSLEIQKIEAQSRLIQFRIDLHKALGGTWPAELKKPDDRTKKKISHNKGGEKI